MITERPCAMKRLRRSATIVLAASSFFAALVRPAFAHHAMGGATPTTFLQGLLSGFAHPVIELPHLAAILMVGLVAARLARPAWITLFVSGSFLGTAALGLAFPLPLGETLVSASPLLVAALLLVRSPAGDFVGALLVFAIGIVHGMAFAEEIVGAENTPLAAYLLGLAIMELALAGTAWLVTFGLSHAIETRVRASDQARGRGA